MTDPSSGPPPYGAPAYFAPPPYPPQRSRQPSTGVVVAITVGAVVLLMFVIGVLSAIAIPIYLTQREKSNDVAAKTDALALGKEVAIYFVDHDGGVPPIEVVGGYYAVDGVVTDSVASEGVEFGGVEGTGYDDWCVWVTAPGGAEKTFEYSATGGLRVGTC